MMTGTNTLLRIDDKRVEHLVSIARNPGGGGHGAPVAELAKYNFKLMVYFIKQVDKTGRPIEMNEIHPIHLSEV